MDWKGSLQDQRSVSTSRVYAELVKVLNSPRGLNEGPPWGEVQFYVDLLKWNFHLPRVLTFSPRNSVPAGTQYKGYDEDYYLRT